VLSKKARKHIEDVRECDRCNVGLVSQKTWIWRGWHVQGSPFCTKHDKEVIELHQNWKSSDCIFDDSFDNYEMKKRDNPYYVK
jgi:hypothetical protein